MSYLKWTRGEIEHLEGGEGMVVILTEVDDLGRVLREVGLNGGGRIVHLAPSEHCAYGLFDLQTVAAVPGQDDISADDFDSLWHGGLSRAQGHESGNSG